MICILSLRLSFHLSHFSGKGSGLPVSRPMMLPFSLSFDHASVKEQLVLVLSSVSRRCLLFAEVLNHMHFGKL